MPTAWFEKLRARREELGWTPSELSKRSKVSRPQILSIEEGNVKFPRRETILHLAAAMAFDPDWLYADEESEFEGEREFVFEVRDPVLEEIQVNLKTLRKLDPEAVERLAEIILAVKERAEREAKG
jgi:transcriptional regulator with XRE-family HTH domain